MPFQNDIYSFSIELPFDPLLGIYPKDTKTQIRKDTLTQMFTVALFGIWKQSECPKTDERVKMFWCILCNGILFRN